MDPHQLLEMQSEQNYSSLADSLEPLSLKHEEIDEEESSPPSRKNRKRGAKRQEKPPYSYIALIAMAISKRDDQKATLAEIYTFLQENFSFFRGEYVGWRNSIRHNLSLNDCFVKLPKDAGERGRKGHKWTINESCEFLFDEGAFRRRPRGYKARKRPIQYPYGQFNYQEQDMQSFKPVVMDVAQALPNVPMPSPMTMPYPSSYFGDWSTQPYWCGTYGTDMMTAPYVYPDGIANSSSYDDWTVRMDMYPTGFYPVAPQPAVEVQAEQNAELVLEMGMPNELMA